MEEKPFEYVVPATVRPVEESDLDSFLASVSASGNDIEALRSDLFKRHDATPDPIYNGKPRMLHITAFIAHEGVNDNRQGFRGEELEQIVRQRALFRGPNAGMLDVNHDFEPRGYWYDAEYRYDEKAKANGILAHGAIWAWRFNELAEKLLAEQLRNGKVDVSISALSYSKNVEYVTDDDGRTAAIMHDPVVVAASVIIDASPADKNANGLIEEDPNARTDDARKAELLKVRRMKASHEPTGTQRIEASLDSIIGEVGGMPELKEILAEMLAGLGLDAKLEDIVTQINAAMDSKVSEVRAEFASQAEQLAQEKQRADEAVARVAALEAELETLKAEKDLTIGNLTETKASLEQRINEIEAELNTYREAEEARRVEEVKAARVASLPETLQRRIGEMVEEERTKLVTAWANLTDEQWEDRKKELTIGVVEAAEPRRGLPGGLGAIVDGGRAKSLKEFLR